MVTATRINTNRITDGSVTGNKIGTTAVASNNIVNGAITNAKLSEPNALEDVFIFGIGT